MLIRLPRRYNDGKLHTVVCAWDEKKPPRLWIDGRRVRWPRLRRLVAPPDHAAGWWSVRTVPDLAARVGRSVSDLAE